MTRRQAPSQFSRKNDSPKFLAAMEAMRRPIPGGFANKAGLMGDAALARLYKAGQGTVRRWRRECGVPSRARENRDNAQMPESFIEIACGKTVKEAARYFGRDTRTIRRWFAYAGLTPKTERFVSTRAVKRAELDQSIPSLAAHHLRRFYPSVHRADIRLKENERITWGDERKLPDGGRGLYYVAGLGAIPDYEMIALARDHGFMDAPTWP